MPVPEQRSNLLVTVELTDRTWVPTSECRITINGAMDATVAAQSLLKASRFSMMAEQPSNRGMRAGYARVVLPLHDRVLAR